MGKSSHNIKEEIAEATLPYVKGSFCHVKVIARKVTIERYRWEESVIFFNQGALQVTILHPVSSRIAEHNFWMQSYISEAKLDEGAHIMRFKLITDFCCSIVLKHIGSREWCWIQFFVPTLCLHPILAFSLSVYVAVYFLL